MSLHQLITIPFSHYNERARWALDRFEVAYRERPYMPLFHLAPTLLASRGRGKSDKVSSKFSTPILLTDDGRTLLDSTDILHYVGDRFSERGPSLFPTPEADGLARQYHDRLGGHARTIAYFHLLKHWHLIEAAADANVGVVQARSFRLVSPLLKKMMQQQVTPKRYEKSLSFARSEFAAVGERLNDGRRFLTGKHFTAADLTFAALASPFLLVQPEEGFGAVLPQPGACPPLDAVAQEFRRTPAGAFAMRLFREERGKRQHP